jgi:RHS repeat-associated protein
VKRDSGTGDGFSYDRTQQILAFQQNATVDINAGTISGGQTTTLEFDGCGNRTKLNGTSMAPPNSLDQPTDAGMGHDSNGNMQTYDGWNFSYDAQNRLISAIKGSTTATFSYDAKNRQIARSINGVVTFSVWDNWELVEEYTTGNVRTAAYLQGVHGPVKSLLNTAYYYYQDSLGSTSHIADASGTLREYYTYNLYGKPTYWAPNNPQALSASAWGVRDLFSGERWISELSLYDLRNRYYSPDLGRFLQPDPIGFKGDASNLYRYCGNDWANRTDPMGLQAAPGDNREQMRQPDYGCQEKNAETERAFQAYAPTAAAMERQARQESGNYKEGKEFHGDIHAEKVTQKGADPNCLVYVSPQQMATGIKGVYISKTKSDKGNEANFGLTSNPASKTYGLTPKYTISRPTKAGKEGMISEIPRGLLCGGQAHYHVDGRGFSGNDYSFANTFGVPVFIGRSNQVYMYVPRANAPEHFDRPAGQEFRLGP